ncbi:MAG: hypothetical protein L0271_16900, partial [Gemmatimonadetes bacterium]|nr:hypothetical protein [Gemmatimonadota bacterium]
NELDDVGRGHVRLPDLLRWVAIPTGVQGACQRMPRINVFKINTIFTRTGMESAAAHRDGAATITNAPESRD